MLVLRRGDKGSVVALLQDRLNYHGHTLGVDGEFGVKTERVLKDFQFAWNLEADGICGDRSWGCLLQQKGLSKGTVRQRRKMPKILDEVLMSKGGSEDGLLLCRTALLDLGKEENPWGKNKGDQIAHLVQGTRITGVGECEFSEYKRHWGIGSTMKFPPWCAISVSGWMAIAFEADDWGDIPFGNWFGGVTQTMKWADARGGLRREAGECRAGELFVMPRAGSGSDGDDKDGARVRGGHIGLILWDDGERVQTIEGNTQNGVRTRSRLKNSLWGVVDWELALKSGK
jgi:hypothetical protein